LIDFATIFDDALLLIRIGRFVVLRDLIALAALLADHNSSRIAQISRVANIIVDENNQGAAAAVVSLLSPIRISLDESLSQSVGNILSPVQIEEKLMQILLKILRTFWPSMAIINAKPLGVLLQIDSDLVLIGLPVETLVGNCGVSFQVGSETALDSFRNFRNFLLGLLGLLLLFTLLTGKTEKGTFERLGDEIGIDAVLIDDGGGENFLEVFTGIARLDERLLLLGFGLLRLNLHERDVFGTLDSGVRGILLFDLGSFGVNCSVGVVILEGVGRPHVVWLVAHGV
jgi:hypothetical protein